jgi:hypothetical protein
MRYGDLVRLNEPYGDGFEPTDTDARAALGLKLPRWTTLDEEIHGDIVEQDPYGVGWSAPEPGTSRRILIGDQLYCCLTSAVSNMIEAALHWLEYLEAADRDDDRFADAVKMGPGGPTICLPRPRTYDQLCPHVLRLHQAGLIRSLASALDRLAGVMIGVVPRLNQSEGARPHLTRRRHGSSLPQRRLCQCTNSRRSARNRCATSHKLTSG